LRHRGASHPKKSGRVFRQGWKVKYAFIALHRLRFSVRTMCRLLRVHPSGIYTWLKNPLSRRANEDKRQTDLLLRTWEESGKVYGYRKLHDVLLDHGEIRCPNRVARLTRLAGIKAQIGYKRRPGIYGGRPSVAIDTRSTGSSTSRLRTRPGSRTSPIVRLAPIGEAYDWNAKRKEDVKTCLPPAARGHEPKRR
jgi:hypothetical protein